MDKKGVIGLFEIDLMLEMSPTTRDIRYTESLLMGTAFLRMMKDVLKCFQVTMLYFLMMVVEGIGLQLRVFFPIAYLSLIH